MTKLKLTTAVALATMFASSAFAAPPKQRTHLDRDTVAPYGQTTNGYYSYAGAGAANDPDAVIFGNRVIGRDPDMNIRSQMLRDPVPSEY